jgi:hypothetical protein
MNGTILQIFLNNLRALIFAEAKLVDGARIGIAAYLRFNYIREWSRFWW